MRWRGSGGGSSVGSGGGGGGVGGVRVGVGGGGGGGGGLGEGGGVALDRGANATARPVFSFQVRSLQTVADVTERKPWRPDGQEFIGKNVRRFFNAVDGFLVSDGKVTGWLPPEGDDEALWHMVHGDDLDEEDLDETEARFALANYNEGRTEPTDAEVLLVLYMVYISKGK